MNFTQEEVTKKLRVQGNVVEVPLLATFVGVDIYGNVFATSSSGCYLTDNNERLLTNEDGNTIFIGKINQRAIAEIINLTHTNPR